MRLSRRGGVKPGAAGEPRREKARRRDAARGFAQGRWLGLDPRAVSGRVRCRTAESSRSRGCVGRAGIVGRNGTPYNSPMNLAGFSRISVDPAVCGGRPVITGTRMRVRDVLEMLASGVQEAEIVADYPYVKAEDVRACLAYAASLSDHPIVDAAE